MKDNNIYDSIEEELIFDNLDETDESRKVGASGNLSFDVMLPYADLMSLLLVFFVFFFIISDFKKGQAIADG